MSLELARQINQQFPEYLQRNVGESCHWFTIKLIELLRAKGHAAYHVCKSPGEGQYIPKGFQSRMVDGLDGKRYLCSGVSHDAIWCDGTQFDTIIAGNDEDAPIFANGRQITGVPTWHEVPAHLWRPNNPPLKGEPVVLPPTPTYPPYPANESEVDGAGVALFADFAQAGEAPNPLMFRFAFRVAFSWLTQEVPDLPASVAKHRSEWRAILGLPPQ